MNFGVIFGFIWELGGDSFSQRIGKIRGKKKFWRFNVVLKLEFEVKKLMDGHPGSPLQPCVLLGEDELFCGVLKLIFFFLSLLSTS